MVEQIPVDFGMERKYVFNALTSDISTIDSILDLIDNSIDAARRDISSKGQALTNGLPTSYEGYEIKLALDEDSITISDNCRGMETDLLKSTVFRLGARHNQSFSIGIYGVGLIRAFWKLGNRGHLITDNGAEAFSLSFTKKDLDENETTLNAVRENTSGRKFNIFKIDQLTLDGVYDFGDGGWNEKLIDRIRRVYGLCIRKGLKIWVGKYQIPEFGPRIRQDISDLRDTRNFVTVNGVSVEVAIGVHEDYTFKGESGWTQRKNREVIPECGWYVVCNDRIVLTADRSLKVGWSSTWHSEYNGILGWVYFTCTNADLLPWDSKKTDISLEKEAQRETAKILRELSNNYRSINRTYKYRESKNNGKKNGKNGGGKSGSKLGQKKPNHNENWDKLLPSMEIAIRDNKLEALIHEAQEIDLKYSYSCSMLYRTLFERAISVRIQKEGRYDDIRRMVYDMEEANGRPFTEEQKKNFKPSLSNYITWLSENENFFSSSYSRDCRRGIKNLKKHIKKLNGVVHEGDLIGSTTLKTIREETYSLLSYLIETSIRKNT
ncbi:ATP-binding protein [Kiloniella litopenaei]|uniref:ATP-binding protein n=1 Tax=Kiloniella litopenaei TaxID=1549748 RepID=UPI003BADA208